MQATETEQCLSACVVIGKLRTDNDTLNSLLPVSTQSTVKTPATTVSPAGLVLRRWHYVAQPPKHSWPQELQATLIAQHLTKQFNTTTYTGLHRSLVSTVYKCALTSWACSTRVALCWRTASTTLMAAARRKLDWDLQATRRGYMRAWG